MTAMKRFDYYEPATLEEASLLLRQFGQAANLLNGGTDLLVEIKEHLRTPDHLINVKKIPGLDQLTFDEENGLAFGATVTARAIETSPVVRGHYPSLAQAAGELGSIQVRNRATVVGNICRASPSADTPPPLIAAGAAVHIFTPAGERSLPLEEFFTGPGKSVLAPGDIVTQVTVPPPAPHTGQIYIKHGRRRAMELATVGVAVFLTVADGRCRQVRIVLGAVAPTPIRARQAEALLHDRQLNEPLLEEAAQLAMAESRPISDVRASADYRREMVCVLTARALRLAREKANP
jgi:aerobic carbon-monoxide dehydrogenase medium subunit